MRLTIQDRAVTIFQLGVNTNEVGVRLDGVFLGNYASLEAGMKAAEDFATKHPLPSPAVRKPSKG